jgi:hypothetical protein
MDITEKRRAQLRKIRDERFGGVGARLAAAIGRDPGYIWRLLGDNKKWRKGIAEKFCRDVEEKLGLPEFYLDGLSETETPPQVSRQLLDVDLLDRSLAAVDLYIEARPGRSATRRERIELTSILYDFFLGEDVSDDQMQRFLEKWTIRAMNGNMKDK